MSSPGLVSAIRWRHWPLHGRVVIWHTGELACGAALRGLKAPAEAVLEVAEVLVRCVEVARRLGSQIPWRSGSPEYETGAAALRRDVERGRDASEGGSGTRRSQRGLAALQSAAGAAGW